MPSQHRMGLQTSPFKEEGFCDFLSASNKVIEENRKEEEEENENEQESTALPKEDNEEGEETENLDKTPAGVAIFERNWIEKATHKRGQSAKSSRNCPLEVQSEIKNSRS